MAAEEDCVPGGIIMRIFGRDTADALAGLGAGARRPRVTKDRRPWARTEARGGRVRRRAPVSDGVTLRAPQCGQAGAMFANNRIRFAG